MRRTFMRVALSCASAALLGSIPAGDAAAQAFVDPVDLSSLATGVEQRDPAAAFDGTSHLVVWEQGLRIWGARLNVGGGVEQAPFEIASSAAAGAVRVAPAVAALGPGGPFLVVWAEETGSASQWDVRGARVSSAGDVLDAGGFDVSTALTDVGGVPTPGPALGSQERPAVAASGSEFLVVWQDGRADAAAPDIFGARVGADGTVVDAEGLALSQEVTVQRAPSVASNGASYLVVWEDGPPAGPFDVFGTRVDATTWVVQPDFFISAQPGDQLDAKVASNGAGFLVAWNDQRSGAWQLYGARMDGAGALADPAGIVLAPLDGATAHAISSDGSGWLVGFERLASGASAVRVATSGPASAEVSVDATVVPPGQSLSFGGVGRHLAVHREDVGGTAQLAGALVTTLERLTVTLAGSGSGSVTSAPQGIDCGTACAADFETGSEVLLSASADPGSTFQSWSGCTPTDATCIATMSAPAAVVATFVPSVPGTPGTPTYGEIGTTSLRVSWTAAADATSYRLERAPDVSGAPVGWLEISAGASDTTFLDTGLSGKTTYWYRVRGTNAGVDGPYSSATSVVTATPLPGAPGTPTFTGITTTTVVVSWGAAAYAESYAIERAPDVSGAIGTWAELASGVAGTSYASAGAAANTAYWYRVRAANTAGAGEYSAAARAVTLPDAPGAPTFSSIAATSLTVGWTAPVGGAATYDLERGTSAAGPWTRLATGTTALGYADSGVAAGTTYWYRVRGANSDGAGGAWAAASVVTLPGAPAAPTFSGIGATALTVSWGAVAGATSYDVERGTAAAGPFTPVVSGTAALSAADSGLAAGTQYWYRVRASNAGGAGAYSPVAQTITRPDAPGTPTFTNVAATTVTVSWTAATGAASYKIERAPDVSGAPGSWAQIASVAAAPYAATGLSGNTKYWYRVRATNASGDGAYSAAASVVTLPAPPGGPTFSSITTTSLTVRWTAPAGGAASYDLDRGTSASGPWTSLAVATAALTYADAGLTAGTTYWYRVRATNTAGTSAYAAGSVPTLPEPPAAPTFTNIGMYSLDVSWPAVTGATSYKVERAPDVSGAPGAWTQLSPVSAPPLADGALLVNTTYWYRLRASNSSGDSAYSGTSSVTTLPASPGKPTFSSVAGTSLVVGWTAPSSGATSYVVERATSATGPWTQVAAGITGLSQADSGLSPGTTYWYRVAATNAAGATGSWSQASSVVTVPDATGAPTYTGITPLALTVHWASISGATTYELGRAPDVSGQPGTWASVAEGLLDTYFNDVTSPNTAWWYRVRGHNSSGYGPWSPASLVTTYPGAPGAPTFTDVSATGVMVSWTAPAGGATSYVVERAASSAGPWAAVASGVTTLSWADTTLSPGTTYWYRIRAANAAGTGAASSIASVTTLPGAPIAAPGAPTFGAVGTSTVTVSWTDTSSTSSWELERAPDAGGAAGTWAPIVTVTTRSYADTGLAANAAYWYRVRGSSAGGPGPYSAASSVVTLPGAPGTPSFAGVATTTLTVAWAAPSGGAATYAVERATSAAGPWTRLASALGAASYADSGLAAATTYYYRVAGANAAGASGAWSATGSVTTAAEPPPPPGIPGAPVFSAVTALALRVGWSAVDGATSYAVERATDAGGVPAATWTRSASTTSLSWYETGRTANTVYWYRVLASAATGTGVGPAAAVMTAPGAPGAPTFASIAATTLTVSWTAPAGGAASYDLERATSAAGPWSRIASAIPGTSHADSGLLGSTTYSYRVRATNTAGVSGSWAPTRAVTTLADTATLPPGTPGAPAFSGVLSTSLVVSWASATGATGYKLERSSSGAGPWTQIAAIASTSFTDIGRSANTAYWYRVRGTNPGGDGAYSAASSVTTAPNAPGTPAFTSIGTTQVTVSWAAPAGGAATYAVERATGTGTWAQVASGIAATTYTSTGLAENTTYRFRVRAANVTGIAGLPSGSSSVTTLPSATAALPGAPGAPTYSSIGASSLRVSWTAATGATGYRLERASAPAGPWTQIASLGVTTFADSGRSANTAYWYRVRGTNAGGSGPYSAATGVTTAPNAPGAPTFGPVAVTALALAWTAPAGGAASYAIERATAAAGPWARIANGVTALAYSDSGLSGNTTYYYRVRGANAAGLVGLPSASRAVTTAVDVAIALPGAPGPATFTNVGTTSLRASWTAASGAARYELERATAADGPWTSVVATTATSFTDTGRLPDTAYWYRVRASNAGGAGPWAEARSVTTLPNAPGAPAFASVTDSAVTVSWTAPPGGAASYVLERAAGSAGPWAPVATGLTSRVYVDAGLAAATTYWYRVRAANADGATGASSVARSVTTAAAPPGI